MHNKIATLFSCIFLFFNLFAFSQIDYKFSEINKTTSYYQTLNKNYIRTNESFKSLSLDQLSSAWSYIDFDKDGDQDFIFAAPCYDKTCGDTRKKVYILKNDNGKFNLWKTLDGFKWPRKGGLADFDNNGYLDFWVADTGPDYPPFPGSEFGIVFFYKDSAVTKLIPNSIDYNHTASSGDIDNDGDIDIVTVAYKYLNDGFGNFTRSKSLSVSTIDTVSNVGGGYYHHELMDLNNDGYLDAIFGHAEIFGDSVWDSNPRQFNGRNRIYWGNGKGDYYYSNSTQLPMTYPATKDTFSIVDDFDFYDFNQDGYQDIIVLRSCWRGVGYYIQILENRRNKEFIEVTDKYISNFKLSRVGEPGSFNWFVWIRIVDLNNDNLPDFIVREPAAPKTVPNNEREWYWINKNSFFTQDTVYIPCGIKEKPLFSTTKPSFCSGDSLRLSITNLNKGDTLKWYFGSKSDISNVANKTFTDSSKVFVTRTDSLGCIISSDTIQLKKFSIPGSPSLSRDADNNLVSNSTGITWYKDGVKIADTTQKIKPTTNGIYTATITQNGCTSSISQGYYYLTNAVANLSNGEYFKVSPNPTSGELNINHNISSSRDINISIFDINGRAVLLNKKVESGSKVNLGAISKGNYIIQVKDKTGRVLLTQKIIKD